MTRKTFKISHLRIHLPLDELTVSNWLIALMTNQNTARKHMEQMDGWLIDQNRYPGMKPYFDTIFGMYSWYSVSYEVLITPLEVQVSAENTQVCSWPMMGPRVDLSPSSILRFIGFVAQNSLDRQCHYIGLIVQCIFISSKQWHSQCIVLSEGGEVKGNRTYPTSGSLVNMKFPTWQCINQCYSLKNGNNSWYFSGIYVFVSV